MNLLTPLDYDPFAADQMDPCDKVFKDKMVTARKEHSCFHCKGVIAPKSQYRHMVGLIDGAIHECKFCAACCAAMVKDLEEEDDENCEEQAFHFEERWKPNP